MVALIPDSPQRNSRGFQKVVAAFLSGPGLPFAEVLSAERIGRIFARHDCLFGRHGVYSTAIVVWSFLSQVLRDGKEASCQAAVARVVSYCELAGLDAPTQDTGDYCRARGKLSAAALHELSCEVAEDLEQAADESWLWKDKHHAKLIDGFTTLVDADEYTKEDIAELYGFRWNSELDIRGIKASLNLAHVRCKSPEMVHCEVWTTILGYNLIRTTAAGAALLHGKQPRQISFTSTCQFVLASWMQLSGGLIDASLLEDYLLLMLNQIAACEVGNRPGRLEPRVLKRRRHRYKLMQKPRSQLRCELRKQCT